MANLPLKKMNVACIVPFNEKGELLLQKKTMDYHFLPGTWALFGGGIENGETPEQAARRELKEELVDVDFDQFKFILKEDYKDAGLHDIRWGELHIFGGIFKEKLSDLRILEGGGFALFRGDELDNINLMPHLRPILRKVLEKIKSLN